MSLETNPKSRRAEVVIQELEDEVLKTNKAYCLNHTAAFVWQHAAGQTPVREIARLLQKKLRAALDESVVWFALEQLAKDNLLENKTQAPVMFAGMNRRDLIATLKRIAFNRPEQ